MRRTERHCFLWERFLLNVMDDVQQGTPGGNDPDGRWISYMNGKLYDPIAETFEYAVVECPEPAALSLLALCGVLLARRRR